MGSERAALLESITHRSVFAFGEKNSHILATQQPDGSSQQHRSPVVPQKVPHRGKSTKPVLTGQKKEKQPFSYLHIKPARVGKKKNTSMTKYKAQCV